MKQLLVFMPAVLIVFTLCACGTVGTEADVAPGTPAVIENTDITPAEITPGETAPTETIPPDYDPEDYIGFYDPYFDYMSAPRYKIQFIALADNGLVEMFDVAFSHWVSKMNLDYGGLWETGGDTEAFFNQIPEFVSQGVDGFLIDADSSMYLRIGELLTELDTPWMPCTTAPRDTGQASAPLLHPYVAFDHYAIGVHLTEKLFALKDELWPGVSYEEIGMLIEDDNYYIQGTPLYDRQQGIYDAWMEKTGLEERVFYTTKAYDGGGSMDDYRAPYLIKRIISENTGIRYWLLAAPYSILAESAAEIVTALGLDSNVCIVSASIPGSFDNLQSQWDSGIKNAWRAEAHTPATIFAEPIVGALYAFMSGQATPETVWPQWVDVNDCGGEGGTYASLMVPSYWLEYDNYQRILKWSDIYVGSNFFPEYPADGITPESYNARAEVPAYYSIKAQD